VFFDRASLPPGESYDTRIREAVENSHLVVFLVSSRSVEPGSYALSELSFAQHKWQTPSGHVLPVLVSEVDFESLPPYLSAVTVLRPKGDLVADVAAAVSRMQRRWILPRIYLVAGLLGILLLAVIAWKWWPETREQPQPTGPEVLGPDLVKGDPVKVIGSLGNAGWTLNLDILSEKPLTEIFYRFSEDDDFRTTGFAQHRDQRTGLPKPRSFIAAGHLQGRHTLLVKFSDSAGIEHGPFQVEFDAAEQIVAWTKQVLDQTRKSWLAFREYPEGRMLLYFTHLLSYKSGLREIRYSIDDESLSQRVQFERVEPGAASTISEKDEVYLEIPVATQFVALKLGFIDGSEWPVRRFPLIETP